MNISTHSKEFHDTAIELPLPEQYFREMGIASCTTLFRWERKGLEVLKIGRRRFIYPSKLKQFMDKQGKRKGGNENE